MTNDQPDHMAYTEIVSCYLITYHLHDQSDGVIGCSHLSIAITGPTLNYWTNFKVVFYTGSNCRDSSMISEGIEVY